jgi:ferric-dicitrate binding protein FerR (iron transport regulator)
MPSEFTPPQGAPLDFDALVLMHLDGQLDPVGHDELSRLIASDPAKAARLAEIAELHASLGELGRTSLARIVRPASSTSARAYRRTFRGRRRPVPAWGLAAAALLLVGILIGLPGKSGSSAPPAVLKVAAGSVTVDGRGGRVRVDAGAAPVPLRPGDRLLTGDGVAARIATGPGDHLELGPGTHLWWDASGVPVTLHAGSFTADIVPRMADEPFLVRTPKADLTVLGTRFTVQADEGLSLLAVAHGRVRLTNREDARQVEVADRQMTVTAGAGDLSVVAGMPDTGLTTGLTADYFDNQDFTNWRLQRIDPAIDFDWGKRGPDPRVHGTTFSVRWRGWLVPSYSGPCTLTFLMDDGVRLWLDGRLVLDEWHLTEKLEFSTTVTLEAGRAYQVRLDYFQEPTDALIRWSWAGSGHPKQPVPTSWLRPLHWTPAAR